MAEISGHTVTVEGLQLAVPNLCCRCAKPPTQHLTTQTAVRGFHLGGTKTRSFQLPYCDECANHAKRTNAARLKLYTLTFIIGAAAAALGVLLPSLPAIALILVPCALAITVAMKMREAAGTSVELPHGAWMSMAKGGRSTFFCANKPWADAFAAANNVTPVATTTTDAVRPWIGALLGAAAVSIYVSVAGKPDVYVDNASYEPLQVWVDGKKAMVVPLRLSVGAPPPTLSLAYGPHKLGWSKVDADKPAEESQVKVAWNGDHIYNPQRSTCYWVDVSLYGNTTTSTHDDGPQPVADFYTFDHIDSWFTSNPSTVSTKGSGATRVAVDRMKVCDEARTNGCDATKRAELAKCTRDAYKKNDKNAYGLCLESVVHCGGAPHP